MPSGALSSNDRLRLGASSCLLGEHARFDGGHERDRTYLTHHAKELMLRNHV